MVMQHHKQEKLVHCVQCEGHSEGLYNQNMTISVLSSKQTAGRFATKLGLIVQHFKPECPVGKMRLLHSRSRSQQRLKILVNVCPENIV